MGNTRLDFPAARVSGRRVDHKAGTNQAGGQDADGKQVAYPQGAASYQPRVPFLPQPPSRPVQK